MSHDATFLSLAQQFGLTVASADAPKLINLYHVAYQRGVGVGRMLENVDCSAICHAASQDENDMAATLAATIESRRHL